MTSVTLRESFDMPQPSVRMPGGEVLEVDSMRGTCHNIASGPRRTERRHTIHAHTLRARAHDVAFEGVPA